MENDLTPQTGMLNVGDLCRMFEESEDATYESRQEAERDRDYVDNKQLTAEELSALKKRGQPPVIDNRIKTKIDYLVGLEKQQRVKPKAFPRTPKHEADADGATEALRYVAEEQSYESKRSGVWRNLLVEGSGGIAVSVEQAVDYSGKQGIEIRLRRIPWDRMFADPHSSEADYDDAGYKGIIIWMDYEDALFQYSDNPEAKNILNVTLSSAPSETYDDKPKWTHWADKKRKRVRICQIWLKRENVWYFAEFTKGGILKAGPSPYVNDKGESDDELVFQSAYVDRDNNRYGLVREMISLQDEINKRRSKSLDLLVRNQVTYEEGAVDDPEEYRRQRVRTDGMMKVNPGALSNPNGPKIVSENRIDLATAHFQLLTEAKNAIDLKGPNATEMGDKAGGSNSASGRAIIASQQGGMIQIGDLMDSLRHLDKRVFRKVWARVRQYWTAEKWIRVTDDEQNVKWLGLNIDPAQMQMIGQTAPDKIAGMVGSVAELDCDIIIDDAPDSLTPQIEQFQALVELKKFDGEGEIPFRSIVRAMPNLKDKQAFLKDMEEQAAQRAQASKPAQELQMRGAQAEVAETESKAMLNVAKAREAGMPEQGSAPEQPEPFAAEKALAEIEALLGKAAQSRAAANKSNTDAMIAPMKAASDARNKQQQLQQRQRATA